ncbi:hypothetical protein Lal_00025496 [Lupinus albus]|nr:hypothetical protein Lal_00025496 [Lupinus albus]
MTESVVRNDTETMKLMIVNNLNMLSQQTCTGEASVAVKATWYFELDFADPITFLPPKDSSATKPSFLLWSMIIDTKLYVAKEKPSTISSISSDFARPMFFLTIILNSLNLQSSTSSVQFCYLQLQ